MSPDTLVLIGFVLGVATAMGIVVILERRFERRQPR